MPEPTTFTEAVQLQTTIMLNIARRLDEKGYAVLLHDSNLDGSLLRGLVTTAVSHGKSKRRRPPIVEINLRRYNLGQLGNQLVKMGEWKKDPLSMPFIFTCRVSDIVKYKPINESLERVSTPMLHNYDAWTAPDEPLYRFKMSTMFEYLGKSRGALEVLLRILDMPQHRAILTGRG